MPAPFTDLVGRYRGKRICVMGGAPSLAEHIAQIDADVWISANHHGIKLRAADFVLCMDDHVNGQGSYWQEPGRIKEYVRQWSDAPIIASDTWADYQLTSWPHSPRRLLSGKVAIWAAWAMGAGVVIVAGMDGYGGTKNSRMVAGMVAEHIVGGNVRVFGGGPLTELWPQYDPAEKFPRYVEPPQLKALRSEDGKTRIRFLKPTAFMGGPRAKGEELTGMRHQFIKLIRQKMAVEIT